MDAAFEQQVRERAYECWVAAGMAGSADKHWLTAEQAVRNEAEKVVAPKKAKAKAVKSAKPGVVKAAAPRKAVKMSAGASA